MKKHHKHKKYHKMSNTRRGILFGLAIIGMLAILATAALLLEQRTYAPIDLTSPTGSAGTESQVATELQTTEPTEATMPTLAADAMSGKQVLNILISGQDRRDPDSWGRSDTMILCSINAQTDTVTMVSFLRDLYVPIPGHGSSRLNHAYSWGGAELLNETLSQDFGATIDGNIEIDFYDFMALIDYIGGVTVDLTEKEANYLNKNGNWDVEKEKAWELVAGENLLTGSQALAYSRIRYLDSDFVRTERQRTVLTKVLEKLHELSWSELQNALDMLLENSTMTFSADELFLYTLGFYPVLSDGEIVTGQIPADGTWKYATVSGMSVIKADLDANKQLLQQWLEGIKTEE